MNPTESAKVCAAQETCDGCPLDETVDACFESQVEIYAAEAARLIAAQAAVVEAARDALADHDERVACGFSEAQPHRITVMTALREALDALGGSDE